jgi:uncharacterized protein YhaN
MKYTTPRKTAALASAAAAVTLALCCGAAQAQKTPSIEDRLREQLRSTTQQLQSLQSEQAQANAAKTSAEQQRDAALAQVKELQGQLSKAAGAANALADQQDKVQAAARSQVEQADAQLGKYKQAYDDLLKLARGKEAERQKTQASLTERDEQLAMCTDRNKQMYSAGQDILKAYEGISTGDIMKIRQPFAQGARVKFEEAAQAYGDKLYNSKYDPRMPVPSAKPGAAAAAQGGAAAPAQAGAAAATSAPVAQ